MAQRPAFALVGGRIVERYFTFEWNPGLAPSQKKKNIAAFHAATGLPSLEISTKSESELGRALSAFNLRLGGFPLECVYQAGKITSKGGPYPDLLKTEPREAKRDPRLSHPVVGFMYGGERWPTRPITAFYDYLYILSVMECFDPLPDLTPYVWFTDIEYNPNRSVSTQARSAALLKAVINEPDVMKDRNSFLEFHMRTVPKVL